MLINFQALEMQARIKAIIALVQEGEKDSALEGLYGLSEDVDKVRILANAQGAPTAKWAQDLAKRWGGQK